MSTDRDRFIYALSDPRDGKIYYVGATTQPAARLSQLICHRTRRAPVFAWIRSLIEVGMRPLLAVVERVTAAEWEEVERRWIQHYRDAGTPLTNLARGGRGTLGVPISSSLRALLPALAQRVHKGAQRSDSAKERMRTAQLQRVERERAAGIVRVQPPRSEETRRRMAEAQRGKKSSLEQRAARSALLRDPNGPYQTAEYKQKLRDAVQARPVAVREAFAKNQIGKTKSPETKARMSEARRLWWVRKKGEDKHVR